jgi:CubicO group peptidase (beta-lactamase class C family)
MTERTEPGTNGDAHFQAICLEVANELKRLRIPGAVVGIAHGDQTWVSGFGVTSVENPLPVTEDTLFQIGSITKTFVATAVMRLVEAGQLQLDTPLRAYLPTLQLSGESVAARVTLRHLLTHTGGWVGDYFNDFGPGEDALATMITKLADLPQLTPLGEIWSYNNAGFYLAGRVIEVVTGKNFEAAMQQLVFDPLGLHQAYFFAYDVMTRRFATGHKVADGQALVARPWGIGRAAHPAGGIICTVRDLLRYARFHMGDGTTADGTRLLTAASLALMQTPQLPSTGLSWSGLSWVITTVDETRLIGHGGATHGQQSLLRLVPARDFAVAAFTNSDRGGILANEIVEQATQAYLGLAQPEPALLTLRDDALAAYTGKYEAALSASEITLRGGQLILQITPKGGFPTPDVPAPQAPPPVRLAFYDEDRVIVLDEPYKSARGEFLRDVEHRLAWFRFGSRLQRRLS